MIVDVVVLVVVIFKENLGKDRDVISALVLKQEGVRNELNSTWAGFVHTQHLRHIPWCLDSREQHSIANVALVHGIEAGC
jgi:hypothetical protein